MKWIFAKLLWGLSLIGVLTTTAQGAEVNLNDPLGVPPVLLGSMMMGMLAVGLAWGDLRRRMMDVEKDVRDMKRSREKWGSNDRTEED